MHNFTKTQKITIVAVILALLFNPMCVQVLDEYFKLAYTGISLLATAWVMGFLLYKILKPEQITVPKKTKKQRVKSSEYIES